MSRTRYDCTGSGAGAGRFAKRNRRLVSCALFVLVMLFSLTGCHGKREQRTFEIPETFDEAGKYEITFWAKNDTNKTQTAIYKKAISDFEKLYPNVTVNLRLYTDYGKIYNDVITNIATDTTPNVCITYPDHIATYLTGQDSVVPLDGLFADEKYGLGGSELKFDSPAQEEIIPQFLEECAFDGSHYAIPYMRSTEACYVNKTFVEQLGYTLPETLTWDFVWEVSEAAMEKNADGTFKLNGQNVLIPFIYKSTDNMMIQMLRQKDAGYSTDAGEIQIFNDTTRELLETIAEHVKSGAFSTFKISGYPANFLNAGQCIFAIDSTAGATWMGTHAPLLDISEDKLVEFETAVMEVPQFDPEQPQMISQGPSVCVFNKADKQEVLASWLFAQYLLTDDVQIAYSQTEGYVPVTSKAAKLLLAHTDDTFVTPVFNGSASLRDAAGQLIETTTKSVRRKQTVDDAYFKKLYEDTASLYHLDQGSAQMDPSGEGTGDLGPLPLTSKLLLAALAAAWVLIAGYVLCSELRKKSRE